ncbi:hypothetical protein KQX54_007698 [Cotesia glomerata]|uniref:Uncharacterized protein n=1 Tax=Cotesia glomerata TaxID=32391 RepID=A0AAV7J702_COTGL|nr:hypothetical protein KQX54_007698 [Cotesia glomerata]
MNGPGESSPEPAIGYRAYRDHLPHCVSSPLMPATPLGKKGGNVDPSEIAKSVYSTHIRYNRIQMHGETRCHPHCEGTAKGLKFRDTPATIIEGGK